MLYNDWKTFPSSSGIEKLNISFDTLPSVKSFIKGWLK